MTLQQQLQATLGAGYSVTRELGGGGMSRVFVAHDDALNRDIAVKVLPDELAAAVNVDRFRREILLAAQLQHPNIVPVLAAGETDGLPYYTMPFVQGESLRERLSRGPLTITDAMSLLREIARALAYAHARGVVHRDIKPDNVLISGGSAVVADFGIAKAISAARTTAPGGTLTQVGTSIGTPAYMAPEQAAGDPSTDQRADLYALGCVAFEVLAGRPPFIEKTPHKLLVAHMTETPPSITSLRPDVPPAVSALVAQLLAKSPEDRPQSADDIIRVLDSVVSSPSAAPVMPSVLMGGAGMFRRALLLYAVAFVVVALVAKTAIVAVGLPDWVFPGALVVMALGLPVILFTGYSFYIARRAAIMTPTYTPGGTSSVAQGTMATIALKASPHLSWRRTMWGGGMAVAAFILLIGGYMVLRALGIGPAGSLLAQGSLESKDQLLIADFESKGSDSTLGPVIAEAVRADLAQSNVVRLLSPSVVASTLTRMQRPATTRLTVDVAREIAQRDGAKAVVAGDVASLGSGYIVSLRLVSADSGVVLASFRETADGTKDLLPAIAKLTHEMRSKMGESLKLVQRSPPLEQVTTSNLEALRMFAKASYANNVQGDWEGSVAYHRQALALDSTFASAWRALSVALRNAGHPRSESDSAAMRAYRYRDRLPVREKLLAEAEYWGGPGRDREKVGQAYEQMLMRDPLDATALNNLGLIESNRRHFLRADSLYMRGYIAQPGFVTLQNLFNNKLNLGRVDDAEALLAKEGAKFPGPGLDDLRSLLEYARGNIDSTVTILNRLRSSPVPTSRVTAYARLASLALVHGHLDEGTRLSAAQSSEAAAAKLVGTPLDPAIAAATTIGWFTEQPEKAAAILDSSLAAHPLNAMPPAQRPYFAIADAYAMAGKPAQARAMLARQAAEVQDTAVRRSTENARHSILADVAMAERRGKDALAELRLYDKRPDGASSQCGACLSARLGRAFDLAGQPDSAITEMEKYVASTSWLRSGVDQYYLAGTYKRLGELYEARHENEKAITNYTKFVQLWTTADPVLQPKVAEVKARLKVLNVGER